MFCKGFSHFCGVSFSFSDHILSFCAKTIANYLFPVAVSHKQAPHIIISTITSFILDEIIRRWLIMNTHVLYIFSYHIIPFNPINVLGLHTNACCIWMAVYQDWLSCTPCRSRNMSSSLGGLLQNRMEPSSHTKLSSSPSSLTAV
jgi:hypothetical protein